MVESCINLKEQFARKYRVVNEESYYAEHGPNAWVGDPWLQIIPCRWGHIGPWDADRLAASVDGHAKVARRLRDLPGVEIVQDGDGGEVTAAFTSDRFDEVAAIMRPRRRRRLSPEQRSAATERLRQYRESKGGFAPKHQANEGFTAHTRPPVSSRA
ncbi:MAG: hypothetical protein NTW96_26685 [Planctomycetia bacterium]|nr:hypothetical protein [Planctomycetia bacterium]